MGQEDVVAVAEDGNVTNAPLVEACICNYKNNKQAMAKNSIYV